MEKEITMQTFGERDYDLEYRKRIGSYGIIKDCGGKFLVVEDEENNYYLIGGRIEDGENPTDALSRESLEEAGYAVEVLRFMGMAEKHWVSSKYSDWSQHNIGFFYMCRLGEKVADPLEKEAMSWVTLSDLEKKLFHEHHLYMVKQSLSLWNSL